jgi:hypothetical protein
MPNRWPITSGNWSNAAIWSGSLIPTASDDVYSNNFTVNVDTSFEVLSLRNTATTGVTAGGSFNFNSGSISGSVTSTVGLSTAGPLVTVTSATGTVIIDFRFGGTIQAVTTAGYVFLNHTGACNLIISGGVNYIGSAGDANTTRVIQKTSGGNITIIGNLTGGSSPNNISRALDVTNGGNTTIFGNLTGGSNQSNHQALNQVGGNIVVVGNVLGGSGQTTNEGISFSNGTSLTITGNVVGGATAVAVNTTAPTFIIGNVSGSAAAGITTNAPVIVSGSVIAGSSPGITSSPTVAIFVNVSGSVIASATSNAIAIFGSTPAASSVVNLAGNQVNVNGKQAIYCQNLFLDNTATTQARFFTFGGSDRTLYSADTFPNLPSASNVRFGTTYGPGSGNTGTLRMASPQDVRSGVLTDNTTGSAILSMESLSNEIQTSTDPFAQRLRNISTVDVVGNLLTAFKK